MGVQGLTTYVEGNRQFLQDVKFRDSRLVIDGCSLYFRLYFTHGLDQQHGGDYDAFARVLIQFLSALAACNIQPFVVLDGGMDPSDKKFATLRQRLQSKIKEADNISHGRNGSVLPILTRDVFIQVLIQRGVPLVQCPAEADWEIACLAHQWNCPVLTNDSDFYIFDLPGGYMPLSFFQWTNLSGKASHRYISARCYTASGLCHWFGGMNRELLPLCAVLIGNDYGTPKDAETLLALIDVSTLGRGGGRGRGRAPSSRIEGLLMWLSSFSSPAEALGEVSRLMGEDGGGGKRGQRGGLSSQLWAGMQEYHITPQSSLARWFSGGKAAPVGRTSGLAQLPGCLSQAAAQGLLSPLVVDALVMRRVLLVPQVENSKLPSSHCSARTIRQAIYGILQQRGQAQDERVQENISQGIRGGRGRGGRGRGGGYGGGGRGQGSFTQQGMYVGNSFQQAAGVATVQAQGSSALICVEEYDRLDLNLKKNQVDAHPPRTPICLDTLGQAPVAVCLGVLYEVLGVKESSLAAVPPHLRLAVAVTGFWLREATPTPSQLLLQALVLGMVYGELSWNNQPGATHYQYAVPQINWAAERHVWAGLDRQRVRPGERRGLDIGAAHSFSQWQACLWSALSLNQLLLLPLPDIHLSWLFSGTLVHGLIRYLKGGRAAESLLAGGSLSAQLYSSLLDAVRSCGSKVHPSASSAARRGRRGRGRGRRGRRGGGRGARGGGQGTEEINNRFALLMSEEESDDDW
ncbi:protein asteroid homolog 1 [Lates calcarifer]|uniref:Protein asteroid homolog 1 n=1 Tax=Lates calcarifer TaxID=8187 RepID=A0A4W6CNN9_LATCA|nr:protein asteroid homolog 1 [Lates calcarifer]XP_018553098.1 protein asteroid homolog 1 [Lates calcarifer]XP_018553099.1 protein asteroid homolog 1 [Lates calcarifer]XP_050922283.1 protein asteroid homolog 1 [Lates calcarifer]XP_050922284.1 protein asteroid homolog 1 [Lates calcarifer]